MFGFRYIALAALLFISADGSSATTMSESICHVECGSLVFDDACDLTSAANDVSVSRFTYDDNRVTRAETLVGEAVFDVAWQRDAGEWKER